MQALARAMKHNYVLKKVVIMDGSILGKFPSYKRTLSLAKLNGCGRAEVRDPATPPERLIQLLLGVGQMYRREKDQHSLQYGLLRECPGLWAKPKPVVA